MDYWPVIPLRPLPTRPAASHATGAPAYSGGVPADDQPLTTPVVSVTTAPDRTLDSDTRIRRYLITMGIRTSCFILMVIFDGWLRWAFLAGAAFLPYIAVVLANSRAPKVGSQLTAVVPRADDVRHLHG